jgi:hypothetical protein
MTSQPPRDEPRVISEWTIDTLYVHMMRVVEDLDKRLQIALKSVEQTAAAAQAAGERATNKAEVAMEKRFDGVNEFRQTLGDQAGRLISRAEVEARMVASDKETAGLASRIDRMEAARDGHQDTDKTRRDNLGLWIAMGAMVAAFLAAALAGVGLFAALYHKV